MGQNTDERLKRAIAALDELSALAHETGFGQSALFLDMARLQLQLVVRDAVDVELQL